MTAITISAPRAHRTVCRRRLHDALQKRVLQPWRVSEAPLAQVETPELSVLRSTLARAIEDAVSPQRYLDPRRQDAWEWLLAPLYQVEPKAKGVDMVEATSAIGICHFSFLRGLIDCFRDDLDDLFGHGAATKLFRAATDRTRHAQ